MGSKPTVLLLITQADIGGAQKHVLEILKRLSGQYHFVLATGFEDYLTTQAQKLNIEVRVLKHLKRSINIKQDILAFKECLAMLRDIKPDLFHIHSSKAGVIGRLAAWKLNTQSLFTAHGWAFTPGAPLIQRFYGLILESFLCRVIGQVVTVSKFDYQLAARFYVGNDNKRFLIRNGVSPATVKLRQTKQEIIQIISVGRLNNQTKNQQLLIKALARLDFPYQAKIVGEGASRQLLVELIESLRLEQKVELIGESQDIQSHLSKADIFVLSSNYEGLPLSILEAMSMGLPVAACDVGGVSEAVLHQQTGLLSARGDVAALTKNISQLAKNPVLRAQYGQRAKQHYQQHFTAQTMIDELSMVYQQALPK